MSGYILCQVRRAKQPFFLKNIQTNIFSIEELCYFIYHNIYLADESIFNDELCYWLAGELRMTVLAQKIRNQLSRSGSLEDLAYPIFKEVGYLTYDELKSLRAMLGIMSRQSLLEREKGRADALMRNRMYTKAIQLYQTALEDPAINQDPELKSSLQHNLGCAYSYMFQMDKAEECFRKAMETSGSEEDVVTWLLALRCIAAPGEYEKSMFKLGIQEETAGKADKEFERVMGLPEPVIAAQDTDRMLADFMEQYHRYTAE